MRDRECGTYTKGQKPYLSLSSPEAKPTSPQWKAIIFKVYGWEEITKKDLLLPVIWTTIEYVIEIS